MYTFPLGQPNLITIPDGRHQIYYTNNLSLNCEVEGKPKFDRIQWEIPPLVEDIFKSAYLSSEEIGKLTKQDTRT